MREQDQIEDVINEVVDRIVNQFGKNKGPATAGHVLNERLITTAQVPQGLSCGAKVIIQPKTVVTPAAFDLFKDRGIEVRRVPVAQAKSAVVKESRQLVVVGRGLPETVKASRLTADLPGRVEFDCVIEAGRNIAEFHRQGRRTVVVIDSPEVAMIALSRHQSLRPVELDIERGADVMERRCTSAAANVLVVGRVDVGHWRLPIMTTKFFELQYAATPAWL